jgi:hypothetical protein
MKRMAAYMKPTLRLGAKKRWNLSPVSKLSKRSHSPVTFIAMLIRHEQNRHSAAHPSFQKISERMLIKNEGIDHPGQPLFSQAQVVYLTVIIEHET